MRHEKQIVQRFYETFGWQRNEQGLYKEIATWLDLRRVLVWYDHYTRMRVKKFFPTKGQFFLDAGSGAIPYPEYLDYSKNYRWRVCVDFSQAAMVEARSKLGERGFCVVADMTALPFKADVFDAVFSGHSLYHVPADEQELAVREFYRTMAPSGSCVILYQRTQCFLAKLAQPWNLRRMIKRIPGTHFVWRTVIKPLLNRPEGTLAPSNAPHRGAPRQHPEIYAHNHDYLWFWQVFPKAWKIQVFSWRSVDCNFTERFVRDNWCGAALLRFMFFLEAVFPYLMVKVGRYPMVIIKKIAPH